MVTDTVRTTLVDANTGQTRGGVQKGALIAFLDSGATVSAAVVKTYQRVSDAEADHATGSKLAKGVEAAINSGLRQVLGTGMAARSGSPYTESFSTAAGTLNTSNLPVTEVTSASNSGSALTVKYTAVDPDTLSPGASEIYFNTLTGKYKTGAAVSASSLSVTYTAHDMQPVLDELDLYDFEYVTLAGVPFSEQYFGLWDKLVDWADAEGKLVAAAYASGAAPADVKTLTEKFRTGNLFLVAAYYTEDLTSAIMAHRARSAVGSTAKESLAPKGAEYTDSYRRGEFGDEKDPGATTFHGFGANAVYKGRDGVYRITNDRSATAYSATDKFHSTKRSKLYAKSIIENDILAARRRDDRALPYTDEGIQAVKTTILGSIGKLQREGVIDYGAVDVPRLSEVPSTDRTDRILDLVDVRVRLTGQIHLVQLVLGVDV